MQLLPKYIPTHVRSTSGRRTALVVRGEDRHGHWDPEVLPRYDLAPIAFELLCLVWGEYKDGKVMQAVEAVE